MQGIKRFLYTVLIVLITSCWWASFALDWGEAKVFKTIPITLAALGSFLLIGRAILWLDDNWKKE